MKKARYDHQEIEDILYRNLSKHCKDIPMVDKQVSRWLSTLSFKQLHAVYMALKVLKTGKHLDMYSTATLIPVQ